MFVLVDSFILVSTISPDKIHREDPVTMLLGGCLLNYWLEIFGLFAPIMSSDIQKNAATTETGSPESSSLSGSTSKKPLRHRIREIVWDSLDRSPEERKLIFKLDIFILYDNYRPSHGLCWRSTEPGQASLISPRTSIRTICRMPTFLAWKKTSMSSETNTRRSPQCGRSDTYSAKFHLKWSAPASDHHSGVPPGNWSGFSSHSQLPPSRLLITSMLVDSW